MRAGTERARPQPLPGTRRARVTTTVQVRAGTRAPETGPNGPHRPGDGPVQRPTPPV